MAQKVRLGIDVGGTFTDAVALDGDTLEILAQVKVPTTHEASRGVAEGVIQALQTILAQPELQAQDIVFIAHGTTQATNALLEGDVVKVGVVGMSSGVDSLRARGQARVADIPLSQGRVLHTAYRFVDTGTPPSERQIQRLAQEMVAEGAHAFVASEAYSVDDPRNELRVMDVIDQMGYPATGTHEISKRYGLRIRTRTSVINASILPKMVHTANMTESSVLEAGITAPLMIMRGDGGAMSIEEMRKRPILTLLSGPAAGVAGALMYARVSDGVFLEVGGTSTDISAIRNGQVLVDNAEVGGHSTYLPSLDVRTVGLAGGSMVRLRKGAIAEVGPRSAHIAGLRYAVYAEPEELVAPELTVLRPRQDDPEEYVAVRTQSGTVFALTLSGAANIVGMATGEVYAAGNLDSARRAFQPLAERLGKTVDEVAKEVLDRAVEKVIPPVRALLKKYGLAESTVVLVGGGGGAAAVVPYLSQKTGYPYEIARNAEVVSTIGVALALVRDMVERTISNPTKGDILRVRREAEDSVLAMGAVPESVEIAVEIDKQLNLVRAIATGALEMRSRDLTAGRVSPEKIMEIAAQSFQAEPAAVQRVASTGQLDVLVWVEEINQLFGLFKDRKRRARVIDREGVIRLKLQDAAVVDSTPAEMPQHMAHIVDKYSAYRDTGQLLPNIFILNRARIVNLTGLASLEQVRAVAEEELAGMPKDSPIVLIADKR